MGKIYIGFTKAESKRRELRLKRAKVVSIILLTAIFIYTIYNL
jgi:hypothetical protein